MSLLSGCTGLSRLAPYNENRRTRVSDGMHGGGGRGGNPGPDRDVPLFPKTRRDGSSHTGHVGFVYRIPAVRKEHDEVAGISQPKPYDGETE